MITITLTMRCPDHPRYAGIRVNKRLIGETGKWCGACFDIYAIQHPGSAHSDYDAEVIIQEVQHGS